MRLRVLLSEPEARYDGMAGRKLRDLGIISEGEQSEGRIFKTFKILLIHQSNKQWDIEILFHLHSCMEKQSFRNVIIIFF